MKTTTAIVLLLTIIAGCKQPEVDTKAEAEKIMQLSREWSDIDANKNLDKSMSYWTDDALVMSPGQPPVKGKKAIRQMMVSNNKIPGYQIHWRPILVEVSKDGDLAYGIEKSQIIILDSLGKEITERLRAVTVWKKQTDGSWKEAVNITNADPLP